MTRESYQRNRLEIIAKVRSRHLDNMKDPRYAELRRCHCQIYNIRESLTNLDKKRKKLKRKLEYWIERRQVLQIERRLERKHGYEHERTNTRTD